MDNVPFIQKISPKLASLLAAAAGWALGGEVSKLGEMTPAQKLEWERATSEKASGTEEDIFKALDTWWKEQYLEKESIPIPPLMGEVFDPVKHRWVRPENAGLTVVEIQGRKRYRGTGAGLHEHSVAGHGSGQARLVDRGKRFRAPHDAGRVRFHDHKAEAGKHPRPKSEIDEEKSHKKHDVLTRLMKPQM